MWKLGCLSPVNGLRSTSLKVLHTCVVFLNTSLLKPCQFSSCVLFKLVAEVVEILDAVARVCPLASFQLTSLRTKKRLTPLFWRRRQIYYPPPPQLLKEVSHAVLYREWDIHLVYYLTSNRTTLYSLVHAGKQHSLTSQPLQTFLLVRGLGILEKS